MKRLADELVGHYRNLMLAALPGGKGLLSGVSPEEEHLYLEKAVQIPQTDSIRAIRAIGSAMEKMTRGSNQRIALELSLFSLTEAPLEVPAAPVAVAPQVAAPQQVKPFAAAPFTAAPVASAVPETPAAEIKTAPAVGELPPWDTAEPAQAQEVLQTEEQPPWENQPAAPQEIPEKQPPRTQTKPEPAAPVEKPAPGEFAPWPQVVEQLQGRDPMLYPYLKNSKAYYDGRRVLIDGGSMFRDFIRANKASQRSIKKVIFEVTSLQCGIGPYEVKTEDQPVDSAEQNLNALQQLGLNVEIKNSENSHH